MAMGKRKRKRQEELWIAASDVPRGPGHPFYTKLNELLAKRGFDEFVEQRCATFYHDSLGRPSIPPGVYIRMLLIGYFEGLDSERGIAWRCADSLGLRAFLGYSLTEGTPDHSSLSVIRNRIDIETHREIFTWVLTTLADSKLLKGKTLGIDATTLEANAAMRSIIRNDTEESYEEFLTGLAQASGIETPTREDLARIDKKRKNKASNNDWHNPYDPDAKITKMKDGRTHLAHKAEHAVDLETGVIVGVTLQPADRGDTTSLDETLAETVESLLDVRAQGGEVELPQEAVADKGYHSNDVCRDLKAMGIRGYISEPDRGRRKWEGKTAGVASEARGVCGAAVRTLLRDGWDAPDASTGPSEDPETVADSRGRIQPGSADAGDDGDRQAAARPGRARGPSWLCFSRLAAATEGPARPQAARDCRLGLPSANGPRGRAPLASLTATSGKPLSSTGC